MGHRNGVKDENGMRSSGTVGGNDLNVIAGNRLGKHSMGGVKFLIQKLNFSDKTGV